jgi:hypothetical protein
VQITYRQSTVRALPSNIGLGFVEGDGIRFNTMKLSPLGNLLAEAFLYQDGGIGKGNKAVAAFLAEWISGQARPGNNADPKSLSQRLGPSNPSKKEKEIVLRRLESFVTGGICSDDRERRLRILNYFKKFNSGSWDNLLDNFDTADKNAGIHANHLRNAKAFEEMRLRCAMLLDSCAIAMNEEELGITVKELSIKPKIKSALGDATISAEQYLTSLKKQGPYPQDAYTFASQMLGDSLEEKLRLILSRDGRILQIFDDKVTKGPLFKTGFSDLEMGDDESDSALPPEKESENFFLLNRLQQFYSLWLNCRGGSE